MVLTYIAWGPANRSSTDCSAASLQLVDLGEPAYSKGSHKGCRPQQEACPRACGHRGHCLGGFHHPKCVCEPGWNGPGCSTPTIPATMGPSSYARIALSFTLEPQVVKAQVRLRTRNVLNGPLLLLSTAQPPASFALHVSYSASSTNSTTLLTSIAVCVYIVYLHIFSSQFWRPRVSSGSISQRASLLSSTCPRSGLVWRA